MNRNFDDEDISDADGEEVLSVGMAIYKELERKHIDIRVQCASLMLALKKICDNTVMGKVGMIMFLLKTVEMLEADIKIEDWD